ncbi:TIR domain-containing protein [Myroides odoratimimus]|uniref:TIR domain-containing protein n=1 Tax=Myroides odoratimimus TaxID=76832 RepID=UPI001CE15372|nr:TIR domain-containing protein [Myroides odoratimimus]MCA4793915.1 TIR domain-containing protein [Myroides odoratimimus]MCA4821185.1 TIR domain-containing protein [Myroides odoratimimus]MDM1504208.1 TIR domain-containing protein [Myroides odoratimimus]
MGKKHNIFISHYYKDDDKVQDLKKRLIDSGYDVRNYSVDSTKHKDGRTPSKAVIERYLKARIAASSTFVCVIGDKTHTRPWVDFEIKEAIKQGKKIIGIFSHGLKDKAEIPESLRKYSASLIGWNSVEKLGNIIAGKESVFETPGNNNNIDGYYKLINTKC